jgi:hypothetical protein
MEVGAQIWNTQHNGWINRAFWLLDLLRAEGEDNLRFSKGWNPPGVSPGWAPWKPTLKPMDIFLLWDKRRQWLCVRQASAQWSLFHSCPFHSQLAPESILNTRGKIQPPLRGWNRLEVARQVKVIQSPCQTPAAQMEPSGKGSEMVVLVGCHRNVSLIGTKPQTGDSKLQHPWLFLLGNGSPEWMVEPR